MNRPGTIRIPQGSAVRFSSRRILLGLLTVGATFAQVQISNTASYPFRDAEPLASPQINQLRKSVEAGDRTAVEDFWQSLKTTGTPIIEVVPENVRYSLVTFVWRGAADTRHVAVIDGVVVGIVGADPVKSLMSRLLETDVWYRTYIVRNDARFHYWLSPNDMLKSLIEPIHSKPKQDSLNSRALYSGGPSYVELSEVSRSSITPVPGNPAGKVEHTTRRSTILNNERDVWVYTPPGFSVTAKPYPLLIAMDGKAYTTSIPVPVILDNLIASKRISPLVAVFIGNVDGLRGVELGCSPAFTDFVAKELVPWIRKDYHATDNPAQTVIAGSSRGGLGAMFAGFRYPNIFGKVLSQSGSFWWAPEEESEPEWLARQFAKTDRLPLEVSLEVGLMEVPDQLGTNRHMRDILTAKGYRFGYQEVNGNHSYIAWRSTFADRLTFLIGTDRVDPSRF